MAYHHSILFEGPDEVGKSTLAAKLNEGPVGELPHNPMSYTYYDRSWLTNWVYRLAMPTFDWSQFPQTSPRLAPITDLVVILPADMEVDAISKKVQAEHGYGPNDYAQVVHTYISMYQLIANLQGSLSPLFRSTSLLQWLPFMKPGTSERQVQLRLLRNSGGAAQAAIKEVLGVATSRTPLLGV